ncbi:hypothetical protein GQ53DRAFT_874532 [Thozetella sp. PMI_491]|nr:hypothetical protein GQ53DRAFT_874532 [Thozetella sp. PMI_491]
MAALATRATAAPPHVSSMALATFFWGFSLASAMFALKKVVEQTFKSRRRSKSRNAYIIMVWMEWSACVAISVLSWLFLRGYIPARYFYVYTVCLWAIQIQCLFQILLNRVTLILYNPDQGQRLKWVVAIIIGIINISVFCIWIPARLHVNDTYVYVNTIWDRIEKVIFLIIDACLNFYFMWLIKSKLVSNGLERYMLLFKFNLFMVCISIALDVTLIGIMSLQDDFVYIQFHPLVYILKLHIEMNIAELIGKILKSSHGRLSSMEASFGSTVPGRRRAASPTAGHSYDAERFGTDSSGAESGEQVCGLETGRLPSGTSGSFGPEQRAGATTADARPATPKGCYHPGQRPHSGTGSLTQSNEKNATEIM